MRVIYERVEHDKLNLAASRSFYRKAGDYMVSSTKRKINSGIRPANAPLTTAVKKGSRTLRDRGQLYASIAAKTTNRFAAVGTNHIAARTNHFGATIRAKKKWLLIPASYETRRMQRKFGNRPKDCIEGMRRAGYNVWFHKSVVLAKTGKGKPFVLYILKKKVVIPARPFLTIDKTDRSVIARIYDRERKAASKGGV
jgi:phage gpG-like protein